MTEKVSHDLNKKKKKNLIKSAKKEEKSYICIKA